MTGSEELPGGRGTERWWVALFTVVAWIAYPREFNRRFLPEMRVLFLRHLRSIPPGRLARLAYVARALGDSVRTGAPMRLRRVRRSGDGLGADVAGAMLALRRHPTTAGIVALTLALPMAANTAILGVVDAALLRPLPYPDPDGLTAVWVSQPDADADRVRLAGPELRLLWDESRSFEALGGIWSRFGTLGGEPGPQHVDIAYVTGEFFEALRATPELGRLIEPGDDRAGVERTIVLSHHLWVGRYGEDPTVVGRRIDFNGTPATVIGVLPRGFRVILPKEARLAAGIDAFLPWAGEYAEMPLAWRFFAVVGRRAPGVGLDRAREELATLAGELRRRHPDYGDGLVRLLAEPLHAEVTAPVRPGLLTLLIAGVLLLLVAGANVSSLLLARTIRREQELTIRAALGAGRGRLVRQIVSEHLMLFLAAGVAGVLLTPSALTAFQALAPQDLRLVHSPVLDWRVLAATFGSVLTVGLFFGTLPAMGIRRDLNPSRLSTRGSTDHKKARSVRGTLVAAEMGLCIMLLVGCGLLLRSFEALRTADPGFQATGVLTGRLSLPSGLYSYRDPDRIAGFYEELLGRLEDRPEITHAGLTEQLPLVAGVNDVEPYSWIGPEGETEWGTTVAHTRPVSSGYFGAVGAELLEGRGFDGTDGLGNDLVVIVDDQLANRAWPGESAVGNRIRIPLFLDGVTYERWARVVGVVRHVQLTPLGGRRPDQVWLHHLQSPRRSSSLVVRGAVDMETLASVVRSTVLSLDPDRPIFEVQPLHALVDRSVAPTRFLFGLTGAFAALAVALAALGLYALLSHTLAAARKEIGIRMALGARPGNVVDAVLRWALAYVAAGAVVGIVGAVSIAGSLRSLLVEVSPRDPLTIAGAVTVMAVVAVAGTVAPLVRALRTDPAEVLDSA